MSRRVGARRFSRTRRGSTLVYFFVIVPALLGVVAFGVDLGHAESAKSEMNAALDAAARYATAGLADGTATSKAIAAAAQNDVDGKPLTLSASNIIIGNYDSTTRTFTANATPSNAIRIDVRGSSAPSIQTCVARAIGLNAMTITGYAFAYDANIGAVSTPTGKINGLVTMGSASMSGPLTINAWDSSTNTVLNTASTWAAPQVAGAAALNNVTLQGELQVNGAISTNGSVITHGITAAPSDLSSMYPMPTVPAGATNMGNYAGPSGATQTFAAGTYYFTSFSVPAGKTVTFSGAATVYIGGSCSIAGVINTAQNLPSNLKLYNTTGSGMDIGANATSPLYAEIYAPNSPMNLNGRTLYGSAVASTLSVSSSSIYLDARSTIGGFGSGTSASGTKVVSVVPKTIN